MKTTGFLGLSVGLMLLAGCTTMQYPKTATSHSSIEQELLLQSMERACNKIGASEDEAMYREQLAVVQGKIDKNKQSMAQYADNPNAKGFYDNANQEYTANQLSYNQLQNVLDECMRRNATIVSLTGKNVFVEVLDSIQNLSAYNVMINESLTQKNVKSVPSLRDAELKLTVIIKVHGLDPSMFLFFPFYMDESLTAKTVLSVTLTKISTGELLYHNTLQGGAYYKRNYVFCFGPFISSSLPESDVSNH